eukprot:522471_1
MVMDNAVVTGWLFDGSYLAPTNSANCPSGGFCTELSGSASTYRTFLNVNTLSSLQIQYDIRCGYCYVDYKYDNHAEFIRVYKRSTSYGTFKHESHSLLNAPTAATNLTVRFVSYNNYKMWIDNFYFNATKNTSTMYAPPVLFYDSMDNTVVTQWLFSGTYLTPTYSTSCPGGAFCTAIYGSSAKIYRTFLDIHDGLHSLQFQFDITCRYCYVDYKYDNHANYIILFSRSASSYGTFKQKLYTLHAPTGAKNVTVRFVSSSVGYYVWIENFYFDAYTLTPTNAPSSSTETPTCAPSSVSQHPSFNPTPSPSLSPTQHPTISPSTSPTTYPTIVTQSPTLMPTMAPSIVPTRQPSPAPTNIPTKPPTLSTIIFYDSMDNAVVTGWSFDGSYLAPTNSGSCPNGGFCTRIYSSSAKMYRTFTNIHDLQSLQIRYDIRCGYCTVQYKYDNHVNYITLYSRSSSSYYTTRGKSHTLHCPTGATTLTVRFVLSHSSYYVWIDNFYFNAEPAVPKTYSPPIIYYDSMDNAVVTGWLFDGSYLAPTNSGNCPNGGFCTRLYNSRMYRTFSDIHGFHSLEFQYDIKCYRCYIDYKYDNHANYIRLFTHSSSTYATYKQKSHTLHAPNEATEVTVRFVGYDYGYLFVDNFYFNASTDSPTTTPSFSPSSITYSPTATPTSAPSLAPTISPTSLTSSPTLQPTSAPTLPPSLHPSSSPTSPPTLQPTYSPTFTPTNTPTLFPSNAPSLFPTYAPIQTPTMHTNTPSNMPSNSPTLSPTFPNEEGFCMDLMNNIHIEYDTTQDECIAYCKFLNCKMINHYKFFKHENDSRCYMFNKLCDLSYNIDNNPSSSVWFNTYPLNKQNIQCIDYPLDWTDITGDSCFMYKKLQWCGDNEILSPYTINDIQPLADNIYGLTAFDACCECSYYGGLYLMLNNIAFIFENHAFKNKLLCHWNHHAYNHQIWQNWDILVLYQWCCDLKQRYKLSTYHFPCIYLIDKYQSSINFNEINIKLCAWDTSYNASYYFMAAWSMNNKSKILTNYINSHWFQIDPSTFSSRINISTTSYELCESELYFPNDYKKIYGIYPCFVVNTSDPSQSPTNIPTFYPTIDPTINPSNNPSVTPTNIPTFYPSIDPTSIPSIDPTNTPTVNPTIDPTINPSNDPSMNPSVEPTINPSNNPSKYPSIGPTITTSNPSTMNPTNNPTQNPTTTPTTSQPTEYDTKDAQTNVNIENHVEKIVIILAIMLTLCVVGLIMLLLKIYKSKTANSSMASLLDIKVKTQVEMAMSKKRLDEGKCEDNDEDIEDHNIYTKPTCPSTEEKQIYCIICWENIANMFNDPCGHVTYCNTCAETATALQLSDEMACPTCRQTIHCKRLYASGFSE